MIKDHGVSTIYECDFCWDFLVPNHKGEFVCPNCGYNFGKIGEAKK